MLVVLAILGMLIGLVGPQLIGLLGSSKQKVAEQQVARLANILDMYRLDVGSFPTTEQGLAALNTAPAGVASWNGPYVKGADVVLDPWGRPFLYRNPSQRQGTPYDLFSHGSDGVPGGTGEAADVFNR